MIRLLKINLLIVSLLAITSCSGNEASTEEKTQINVMDSSSKAIEETTDKLEEQTKKVEESLEKLEKEFDSTN